MTISEDDLLREFEWSLRFFEDKIQEENDWSAYNKSPDTHKAALKWVEDKQEILAKEFYASPDIKEICDFASKYDISVLDELNINIKSKETNRSINISRKDLKND